MSKGWLKLSVPDVDGQLGDELRRLARINGQKIGFLAGATLRKGLETPVFFGEKCSCGEQSEEQEKKGSVSEVAQ